MAKVFLSSVFGAFKAGRDVLLDGLKKAGFDLINMESFGARSQRPLDVCLQELRRADLVVLIVGPRYGSLAPSGDVSYTHEEYREARGRGIPVLAFVLPQAPECDDLERSRLDAFTKEIGQPVTYMETAPDRLAADVLASLIRARDRGELGPRYSIFRTYEKHFAEELNPSHGLHTATPIVGRESELERLIAFAHAGYPLLLIVAPGGAGKSRLLLEFAKQVSAGGAAPKVLFVDGGASWDADDINGLPSVPTILVVDDAHRRPDLDRLIAASREVNDNIRFLVSCRPSAVDIIKPLLPASGTDAQTAELILEPISKESAVELAKAVLGPKFAGNAEQLVRVSDNNPLVIAIGGRCIAREQIAPPMLEQGSDVFRQLVLDRLLSDPALGAGEGKGRRAILELVAVLQPVDLDEEAVRTKCSEHLGIAAPELARELAELQQAGLLRRRGRLIRVSPDVLGDHLLFRAAVDRQGKPTGFIDQVLERFGHGALGNVLANAAELDWKLSSKAESDLVLQSIWRSLLNAVDEMPHGRRADMVRQLKRAAVFAPREVLGICERVLAKPEAPVDERLAALGFVPDASSSAEPACELIGFIATHPEYTTRCVVTLWKYAVADGETKGANAKPIQQRLAQLLKYDANIDSEVQRQVLDFMCDRLTEQRDRRTSAWAVEAIGNVLEREGEANTATRRVFTLRSFSLASSYARFAGRRDKAISCLTALAYGQRLDEAALAIRELEALLRPPEPKFGRDVAAADLTIWLTEAKSTANIIAKIARDAQTVIIRYAGRRALRQTILGHWSAMDANLTELLATVPAVAEEKFFDLLVGAPWSEELDDWKDEEKRIEANCREAADELWTLHATPKAVVEVIAELLISADSVFRLNAEHTWKLVRALVSARPDLGKDLTVLLAESGVAPAVDLVPAALSALTRAGRRSEMEELLKRFLRSHDDRLRERVAHALRYLLGSKDGSPQQLDIVQAFLKDPLRGVRHGAIYSLASFSDIDARRALDLLMAAPWDNEMLTAEIICDQLSANHALDPDLLTEPELLTLLSRIEPLHILDGERHDILEFVNYASGRQPRQVVEMLIRRVRASAAHQGETGHDRWMPIPHRGRRIDLTKIRTSPEFLDMVRLARDVVLDEDAMVHFWSPSLFGAVAGSFNAAEPALREWLSARSPEKLVGAAHLLGAFEREVLFTATDFIADLLEAAAKAEGDTLDRVRRELFSISYSGAYGGTPGQPAQRHLDDAASSAALSKKFASRPLVRQLFEDLNRSAQDWIKRDLDRFEEMDEE